MQEICSLKTKTRKLRCTISAGIFSYEGAQDIEAQEIEGNVIYGNVKLLPKKDKVEDDKTTEAMELLKSKGYRIVKS